MKSASMYLLIICVALLSQVAYGEVTETFYIRFDDLSTAHIVQEVAVKAERGYYLDSTSYTEYFSSRYRNIQVYDDGSGFTSQLQDSKTNFTEYQITTPRVDERTARIFYEYDYPAARVQYKQNFDIELYFINLDRDTARKVSICLPIDYRVPINYDSTPDKPSVSQSGQIETFEPSVVTLSTGLKAFCPDGRLVSVLPQKFDTYLDVVKYRYRDPNVDDSLVTYEGTNLILRGPSVYRSKLSNLNLVETTINDAERLGFKINTLSIDVVDDLDRIFSPLSYELRKDLACFAGSKCFITNKIFLMEDTLQQANAVMTVFLGAIVNTYGNESDNVWGDGALIQLTLDSLKKANFDLSLFGKDLAEFGLDESESKALRFFNEIESQCSQHVSKINKYIYDKELEFKNTKQFNNFLIYALKDTCGIDFAPLFVKYQVIFDRDLFIKLATYQQLKEKALLIPENIKSKNLRDFKDNVATVNDYILRGDFEMAGALLTDLEVDYKRNVVPVLDLLSEYSAIRNQLDQQKYNLFKFVAEYHLSEANSYLSMGDIEGAGQELTFAKWWRIKGPAYTKISVVFVIVVVIAMWIYSQSRKRSNIRAKHKYAH